MPQWPQIYVRWELGLLEELGFALQLETCAITGLSHDLGFVSPKTGRAVSRAAAGAWVDKLLALPAGMGTGVTDVPAALAITGHFLQRELASILNARPLPEARARLVALLERGAKT